MRGELNELAFNHRNELRDKRDTHTRSIRYRFKICGLFRRNEFVDLLYFIEHYLEAMIVYYDIELDATMLKRVLLSWDQSNIPADAPSRGRHVEEESHDETISQCEPEPTYA